MFPEAQRSVRVGFILAIAVSVVGFCVGHWFMAFTIGLFIALAEGIIRTRYVRKKLREAGKLGADGKVIAIKRRDV